MAIKDKEVATKQAAPGARPDATSRPSPALSPKPKPARSTEAPQQSVLSGRMKPVPAGKGILVEATEMGYYRRRRYRQGDVFLLHDPKLFSDKWMKHADGARPTEPTSAQEALDLESANLRGEGGDSDSPI